ncbi:polyhydroxyalkanoate synthesis repressor PhaR [Alsobacter sp. SYSU M60028]|uniref:Polyhydroxyalkanoate synthesis repressor PhaR n=1 Tax=Alsobacter ponti TaxID=2962936 RepID=A0ABT1LBN0_9HYPH|nr:polyhydroxyalkanoate synthesis repressor PhaR [Alsobacter ponti]MCP8938897.1 polyhydroxyalkanoate synthesis repressor PhaR [Alsobacter ponti]
MTTEKKPTVIKKYANRRLYHTGTSTYVTLDDLAGMVKGGEDFVVFDAKTGEEITRSVLAQIIFEQEGKSGQNLLPITFLRQLIRFYGDSMQALVPSYLELSLRTLTQNQQKFRDQLSTTFGQNPFGNAAFTAMDEQAQKNMAMFRDALRMFTPFPLAGGDTGEASDKAEGPAGGEIDDLKKQLIEMQRRLDKLSSK